MNLISLREADYSSMVKEVMNTFEKEELTCIYLQLTSADLDPFFNPVIRKCCDYDYSLAYLNEKH